VIPISALVFQLWWYFTNNVSPLGMLVGMLEVSWSWVLAGIALTGLSGNLRKLSPAQWLRWTHDGGLAWTLFGRQAPANDDGGPGLCEPALTSFLAAGRELVTVVRCPIH
jgi:hypothetical protein